MIKLLDSISGQIIDLHQRRIYNGQIHIKDGRIESIEEISDAPDHFIMPGFVDAHIHIESSMVVPYEFARIALSHGTVATVSDPHEIANVLGLAGVEYMLENAIGAGLKFHFGAPSCVPATGFETSGAKLTVEDLDSLLKKDEIGYLSEMMNYPGVLNEDPEVIAKLALAKKYAKPIDGHAPGLKGEDAVSYASAGISTDHECFTLQEAQDKLDAGMKIIIREGSAAKNFNALHPLIGICPEKLMFCSDDKHPDDLLKGHMNQLVARALKKGYPMFDILTIACVNPVVHYGIDVGLLRIADPADFIVVDNLREFNISKTVIEGKVYFDGTRCDLPSKVHPILNHFDAKLKKEKDFAVYGENGRMSVIKAIDGELITEKSEANLTVDQGIILPDLNNDIIKISVVNRYADADVKTAFIKNFGISNGAIASTVAHDSHNIVVVGSHDHWICKAVNILIKNKGGLSAVGQDWENYLSLPIAGLMSDLPAEEVGKKYEEMDRGAKRLGCPLKAPFMTLSFMALLVIPKIKMSDLGLFDAEAFVFY